MKKLALPLTFSVLLALTYAIFKFFGPGRVGEGNEKYWLAAILASLSVVLVRAIELALFDFLFRRRKGREAPALLRLVLSIIGYSIVFVLIYRFVLKLDLSGVFATSAVVTVILGLALQDTLGNFFAGLSLHIEQPYYIGDAIKMGEMIGRVEAVTWRTTAIRTNNNTVIIVPNSKVAREPLEVFRLSELNRRVLKFPAPYSISPETVFPLVREAVRSFPQVASEKTPIVRIGDFSDSSITYEILYWVRDYMLVHDLDAKIRERIWYIYRRSEIEIPFPIRHVLLESLDTSGKARSFNYEKLIEAVSIFEPLALEEKEAVARSALKYVYAPGEAILRRGDAGSSMFVVYRGKAEVCLPGANGQPQHVAVLEPGNFFGEMALFTGEPRTADVNALEEVEVLEIRKPIIEQLLIENARLAEAFSRKIAERQAELTERSRIVPEREKQMQQETILHRIKRFFSLN